MPQSILLVDEDPEFRSLLRAILDPGGHRVTELGSVAEARAAVEATRFDLAVVDALLPDGEGLALCRWLSGHDADLSLIFFSSFWRAAIRPSDIGGQRTRVLQKPVLPGELRAVLRDALYERSRPEAQRLPLVADFDGVEDLLGFLRDAYRERLDARLAELEASIDAARQQGLTSDETWRVLLLAHDLHGSAGSFGFFEVSAAVGRIELLFERLLAGDIHNYDDFWTQLDEALLRATSGSIRPLSDYGEPAGAHMGRVLVVDDDEAFLRELSELGRRRLVEVHTATSAGEALSRLRDTEVDGLFVRVDLGEAQGGFRFARRLRTQLPVPLPLAFMAEEESLSARVAAAHVGGALFLVKPILEADFVEATRRFTSAAAAEPTRVLVLHEDPEVGQQLGALMDTEGVDLRAAQDPRSLLDMLDAFRPDLLIAEVTLAHISGFDVCRILRLHPRWQDLPVLLRSNGGSAELRAAAFQAGADDFVGVDVQGPELVDRVLQRAQRHRRVLERRDRDPLTGLMTRGVFAELVSGRVSEASRVDRALTIALIDVDRFRQLNDERGVIAGDEVLSTLGRLLSARFRVEDLRARWGGSEFALALSGANCANASAVLARFQEEFSLLRFTTASGAEFGASLSVGLASYPDHGDNAEELIARADVALREARTFGPQGLRAYGEEG